MPTGATIFSQLMDFIPAYEFRKCVQRYNGNYKVKSFSCWDQYMCMAFAQLTFRESLRDIQVCLRMAQPKLYHMGFRGQISRNTLANANQVRDWRIYADFAQVLISTARTLYAKEDFGLDLQQAVYALDSTVIDLCLALFPWAKFRKRKGAIKLHTLLDLHGNIPSVIIITHGKLHDVKILDRMPIEPGAIYIMDRGYLDFARLYQIHQGLAFFVIRSKHNMCFRRVISTPVDKTTGVQCDQGIILAGRQSRQDYPERLRRIRFYDQETGNRIVPITNNWSLSAITIAELYRCRWQVELFFKWIKQHLRIKAFFGTTENAVKTQIWIAISVYVLVAIVKKRLKLEQSLYTILQILSLSLFEQMPIGRALTTSTIQDQITSIDKQLKLFE
jgi:hypothetical protein